MQISRSFSVSPAGTFGPQAARPLIPMPVGSEDPFFCSNRPLSAMSSLTPNVAMPGGNNFVQNDDVECSAAVVKMPGGKPAHCNM